MTTRKNLWGILMTEINPNMAYYQPSPSASRKRKIGATIAGGLIGMNAYYLPVKKDSFVLILYY